MEKSSSWDANRFSASRNSPNFMEPEGSLPQSQVPATCPYPQLLWLFRYMIHIYGEEFLAPRTQPKLEDRPCRLPATAYSIYSQLPSIFVAVPPSAVWELAMPWWQELTYHGDMCTQKHNLKHVLFYVRVCLLPPSALIVHCSDIKEYLRVPFTFWDQVNA
jgi:hypothetical protein